MTETSLSLQTNGLLADLEHHTSLAAHHSKLAAEAQQRLTQYLTGKNTVTASTANRKIPKSVVAWTEWLSVNGPGLRQEVEEGAGMKLTDKGYHYTVEWEDRMASLDDDHFPDDQMLRIRTLRSGRGAAPVAFFLWSQRWDVQDRFEVGPTEPSSIQGVIRPPEPSPDDTVTDVTLEKTEPKEEGTPRYDSMEEWHARWDPLLKAIAPHDVKPSEEEMDEMLATLPPDITDDPKAIVAVAYSTARRATTASEN